MARMSPHVRMMEPRSVTGKAGSKSKLKKSKTKLSYCQRLIQSLDQTEAEVKKAKLARSKPIPPSRFLALPAEIRQHILYSIYNDEIHFLEHNSAAQYLAEVCKTFRDDMQCVRAQWRLRKAELERRQQLFPAGAFDSYIADLMSPVLSASKALPKLKWCSAVRERKRIDNRVAIISRKLRR